jgi:hypothetical protein
MIFYIVEPKMVPNISRIKVCAASFTLDTLSMENLCIRRHERRATQGVVVWWAIKIFFAPAGDQLAVRRALSSSRGGLTTMIGQLTWCAQ